MRFHTSLFGIIILTLSGCFTLPANTKYEGPPERPQSLEDYYGAKQSYTGFTEEISGEKEKFTRKKITIFSEHSPVQISFYDRPEQSDSLILVFPVLGGSNIISEYFARYFALNGYDTAIVHRNDDFKRPENVDRLEEILRRDVLRDRIALDFFEDHYGKKRFGSFGISRGAINVAITAGIDKRLKYNVLAMGGSDLVGMFKDSNQQRMKKYAKTVMASKGISRDQFFTFLEQRIKTDPKYLAKYMDARDTFMVLSQFDRTVPIKYGVALREEIGDPKTVVIPADHYVGLLFTQFLKWIPPTREFSLFPVAYVEGEALTFFDQKFGKKTRSPFFLTKMIEAPFSLIGRILWEVF